MTDIDQIKQSIASGMPYSQIARNLSISKSTVAYWAKHEKIQPGARLDICRANLVKAQIANSNNARHAREFVTEQATKNFKIWVNEPLFAYGLGLYAGEGNKTKQVALSNMDMNLLRSFVKWVSKYLGQAKYSGTIWTCKPDQYKVICLNIETELNVSVKWSDKPNIMPKSSEYTRDFGVVRLFVGGISQSRLTVDTWLRLAASI